jgi:hypothetical protein
MTALRGLHIGSSVGILLLSVCASLSGWGQSLTLPEWLAPFAGARGQAGTALDSTYAALAAPAEVITHYQQQMRAAGVTFETKSDGIGVSIVASAEKTSAVVRIREDGSETQVKVSYALKQDPPLAPVPLQAASAPAAAASETRRAPTSPWTRAPYTWIMQTAIVPSSSPIRYSALYYEAPTDATVEKPLPLPNGANIVDVFPNDCAFSLQDQAGHSFTFRKAEEANGKALAPGTWSLYPIKCRGVSVFLR